MNDSKPTLKSTEPAVAETIEKRHPSKLGHFAIHGVLGEGGFGTVYLGHDDRLKRKVAIKVPKKVLTGAELDHFLEEAQRLAQLRHDSIVKVFDVGESEGFCYIVSDYLEGDSLSKWMETTAYQWWDAATIIATLSEALSHAHAKGIVHRDLKPSNVMMLSHLKPVLIDFGLAISDTMGERETPGMIAGTPSYMSPEQAAGRGHRVDGRTDIYSLGVMLYHMICRKRPFRAATHNELLRQIREDEPQPMRQIVPGIPEQLERICMKAMAKGIKDRYTSAADLASALHEVVKASKVASAAATEVYPEPPAKIPENEVETEPSSKTRHGLHEAERRQITTLYLQFDETYSDDEESDPERFRLVVQRINELTARILGRLEGHVAHSSSESIEAYFGYPQACEDAAKRAILAGLEIIDEFQKLKTRPLRGAELRVDLRVGIHSGIMITEDSGVDTPNSRSSSGLRYSLVGNIPRVAAAVAEITQDGTVAVTAATAQIVRGAFHFRSLGTHSGRSLGKNIELFAVESQKEPSDSDRSTAPLFGRESEIGILSQRWQQARSGLGQIVMVGADAGMGKSRLLASFRQSLGAGEHLILEAGCSPYHQNTAYYPISELLKRVAQFTTNDSDESRLTKLEDLLKKWGLPLDEMIPLLVGVVGIPLGPMYSVVEGTPERRKQKTLEALVELLIAASERQQILVILEDLHWIDPSTLQFLTFLIEQVPSASILLLLAHRPSFTPPWSPRAALAQISIGNLNAEQTAAVVTQVAGGRKLPHEVIQHIVTKTSGVPLFAEELTKLILQSQILEECGTEFRLVKPLSSISIPSTLQDSLMARLDMLGSAKELAQLASVIGRDFTYSLLAAITPLDTETLEAELTKLVNSDLIHQRGFFPRARFTFKHALVQDAAYESLLRKTRQQWHERIADTLVSRPRISGESSPELLAHHYTCAGKTVQAIEYWTNAGMLALERCANKEAISHFQQAAELASTLEESAHREQLEFAFQIPMGVALLTTQGYAAPDVGPAFERARTLGHKLAGPVELFYIHWGIWAWRVVREELDACQQMAEEVQRMIAPLQDPGLQIEADFIAILTSFYRGEFLKTCELSEKAFPLFDEATSKKHALGTGQNVGATLQSYWALALWHLGFPEQAIRRAKSAVEFAQAMKHPFSLAYALCHFSWLHHHCRLGDVVQRTSQEEIQLSQEQGFRFWHAEALFHQGFAHLLNGSPEAGITAIESGLDSFEKTGAKLSICQFQAQVANGHLLCGNPQKGLEWIEQAVKSAAINRNVFYLSEIHRLRGELLLRVAPEAVETAEAAFQMALDISRAQRARSNELRALVSLARLRQTQGRSAEIRGELAKLVDWFKEGHSLPDLMEATALLASLA